MRARPKHERPISQDKSPARALQTAKEDGITIPEPKGCLVVA